MQIKQISRALLLASAALGLGSTASHATPYALLTTIAIPASPDNVPVSNAGGKFQTYDIADVNPATNLVYLADRSNAAVDIFNAQSLTYVGRIGGSSSVGGTVAFGGQQGANNGISGPDGVVVAQNINSVFVGNGSAQPATNSTLYGFSLASNAVTTTTPTGGTGRVDELAYDPTRKVVLAVNNADTPPFLTIANATTGAIIKKITFDGTNGTPNATTGGLEAPLFNSVTGKYYLAIPQIGTTGPGALAEIDPNTFAITKVFDLATVLGASGICGPTGLAMGNDGRILIGCGTQGATQSILVDPRAGALTPIMAVNGIGGEDQVAYDTTRNLYFTASRFQPGGPVLGIIDGTTGLLVQTLATTPGDHSVTVDPNNGDVFVAAGGIAGNTVCANGCLLVFAPVPEPSSLPLLAGGLLAVLGIAGWRVRQA